jgi:6-phosphogluconolactonase (cycloisomerase 2 family)
MRKDGKRRNQRGRVLTGVAILAASAFGWRMWLEASGSARLISTEEVGEACERPVPAESPVRAASENLFAAFEPQSVYAQDSRTQDVTRPPLRYIRDSDPIYSYVALDPRRNEVVMLDSNLWSIRFFDRLENTPPGALRTEPKRIISGDKTVLAFNSCMYIDPQNGDIYSVENDVGNMVEVFSDSAEGDVAPLRKLVVTHRAYALAVDEGKQELFVSVQFPPAVEVYRKQASGEEKPLRVLKGDNTRLADAHGMAIDEKKKLLFVNNWGNISDLKVAGTGRFEEPSITVYSLDAKGDTAPVRVIQGPKTQLDWPGNMSLDPETGDLYVANDVGNSILVFHGTDQGDVAPARVIKGTGTGLSTPVSVIVDAKNRELWVANTGNASATVYPLAANGNVAPLRTIRSAPEGKQSLKFGKTQAVAYDSVRQQILVPN